METNPEFSLTLAAVKKHEISLWEMGDALLAELGPPSKRRTDYEKLETVSTYLSGEYSLERLRELWTCAYVFQGADRHPDLAWAIHRAARTQRCFKQLSLVPRKELGLARIM